jgi:type I restriction enzyme S subunit
MTLDTFFEHFDHFAEAPNAVAKMRELILQLAVQGKLVDRIPEEGDSEPLIEKIHEERNRFIAEGRMKNSSLPHSIDLTSPVPFVPDHWRWILLGNLVSKLGSGSTPRGGSKVYQNKGVPFLRSQNIWNDGIHLDDVVYIDDETHEKMRNTHVHPHDILLNITGASLGRCAIVPPTLLSANVSQHVTIIRPLLTETKQFIQICLLAPFGQSMIWGRQVGMAREGLSKKVLERFEMPIPPLAEQKRIVAKVDELMALCDKLEEQQRERDQLFPLLSQSAHARFAASPTPANLEAIFTESINVSPVDVRKTILALAVSGQLVNPNRDDESAEKLLGKISLGRSELIRRKAIGKPKKLSRPKPAPHSIPHSWKWVQLGEITYLIEYGTSQKADDNPLNIPVYRMGNIQNGLLIDERMKYVSEDIDDLPRLYLEPGDILFNRTNSAELVGKAGMYVGSSNKKTFASYLIRIRLPREYVIPKYINYCFLAPYYRSTQIEPELTQQCGQANFNGTKLANSSFPLPPLTEQKRIVAKVDELMAVVDRLEKQQKQATETAALYAQTAVAEITGTPSSCTVSAPPSNGTGRRGRPPKS